MTELRWCDGCGRYVAALPCRKCCFGDDRRGHGGRPRVPVARAFGVADPTAPGYALVLEIDRIFAPDPKGLRELSPPDRDYANRRVRSARRQRLARG